MLNVRACKYIYGLDLLGDKEFRPKMALRFSIEPEKRLEKNITLDLFSD